MNKFDSLETALNYILEEHNFNYTINNLQEPLNLTYVKLYVNIRPKFTCKPNYSLPSDSITTSTHFRTNLLPNTNYN